MRHRYAVLNGSGHTTLEFAPDIPAEVDQARREFEEIMRGGQWHIVALAHGAAGEDVKLTSFDPLARDVVMFQQLVGG